MSDEGASRAGQDRPLPEEHVAERIKLEREARGWSTVTLAERMAEAGHVVNQSAIWRIESGKPRRRVNLDEAIGFCKVFDLTLEELSSPPGQLANPLVRRLIGEYVDRWKEWRALSKDMRRIQDDLKAYTDANPNQEDMVKGLFTHEMAVASNGEFHHHNAAPPKLRSYLGDRMNGPTDTN
ncbi:helix-turn-helix transcriptional regulator [Streptomyces sp. SID13588]|uniref:helix-turn-helix domain-containing protein n=1 Tax=Streptomyces sp. SID13588 TaxID=2706051 RepID=UPI0031BA621F